MTSQDGTTKDVEQQFRFAQTDLAKLRDAWSNTRQSKGGVVNLRGFHFQMLTALSHLVSYFIDADQLQQNDPSIVPIWIEALSDWTEIGKTVVACQVKLTQGSSEISKALSEFWQIDNLARAMFPEKIVRLQYRILSRQSHLKDVAGSISRWFPEDKPDRGTIETFKGKVSWSIAADPEAELLSLLANHFYAEDPLQQVQQWLGLLFAACDTNSSFDSALRQIWTDLQRLRNSDRERPPIGYLWTSKDCSPEAIKPGAVLTGQRPTAWHLR